MARRPSPNNGPANPAPLKFEEAVKSFRERVAVSDADWRAMSEGARQRAFKVAGVAQLDLVAQTWKALDKAIADGKTLADFKKEVGPALKKEWGGSVKNPGARLETIFRTNVQTAYSHGTWTQLQKPETRRIRPFIKSTAILGDGRTSLICATIKTVILPAEHPWWLTHWAPLHFNCRRAQTGLTQKQAEKQGITQVPPVQDAAPGFGRAPGMGGDWQPDVSDAPLPLQVVHDAKSQQPIPPVDVPLVPPVGRVRGDSAALIEDAVPWLANSLGDRLRVDGAADSQVVREALQDLADLPVPLLDRLRLAATDIHISTASITTMGRSGEAGRLANVETGHHGGGVTWDMLGGMFIPTTKKGGEVLVTSFGASGSASTSLHESAHALDRYGGDSKGKAFKKAWAAFHAGNGTHRADPYYSEADGYGEKEAFAEAFAIFWKHGGTERGETQVALAFGQPIADYLKEHYGPARWRKSDE